MEPTAQEILQSQGTRLSNTAPWESYDQEMGGPKMTPELAAQVAEYAQKHYGNDGKVSNQTKEILHEQQEINQEIAKQYSWLPQAEYEDEEPRIGRVLNHAEFISMLRNAGVCCHYRQHTMPDKATLYVSKNGFTAEVACWVQINGPMPEYELVNFDDKGVVVNTRRRGWRTCLLQMILKGMITEEQAEKHFGKAKGPASHRFNSLLYEWRNRKIEVV